MIGKVAGPEAEAGAAKSPGATPELPPGPRGRDGIEKAAAAFEEILVQTLVASMRETLPKDEGGLFGAGAGAGIYEGMFDQGVAEAIAPKMGLGLSKALLRQLSPEIRRPSGLSGTSVERSMNESSQTVQVAVSSQVPASPSEIRRRGIHENPWRENR